MRILFLSNFYPPARAGGYTQWCQEVAERLAARGHPIGVLTSGAGQAQAPGRERDVYRVLHLEGDLAYYQPLRFFTHWKRQHRENLAQLARTIDAFEPDLVFVWGMWALSRMLPAAAERRLPGRVAYYLSDYWPAAVDMHTAYWRAPARRWFMRLPRRALGRLALGMLAAEGRPDLKLERAMCVSARVRELLVQAGVPVEHARIIHGGTDVGRFPTARQQANGAGGLKLLYAGQLVEHKGVHTAIEALARLGHQPGMGPIRLDLIGAGHPDYEAFLRRLVAREGLQAQVTFRRPAAKDAMPGVLAQYDVLVFPSTYEEPLARITQEAMAAGLVVVGTLTGGTPEILKAGETGLTFAPGDADGLANQITRLAADPGLRRRLAQAGRQTVLEHFTLDRMVAEIEAYLVDGCSGHAG